MDSEKGASFHGGNPDFSGPDPERLKGRIRELGGTIHDLRRKVSRQRREMKEIRRSAHRALEQLCGEGVPYDLATVQPARVTQAGVSPAGCRFETETIEAVAEELSRIRVKAGSQDESTEASK